MFQRLRQKLGLAAKSRAEKWLKVRQRLNLICFSSGRKGCYLEIWDEFW